MNQQQQTLCIDVGGQQLQGLLTRAQSLPVPVGVILHPHPCYGGNMHNDVVMAFDRLLGEIGCSTLRFNFRGAAGSQTEYAGPQGAIEDTLKFVEALKQLLPNTRIGLLGYSFGGSVALCVAAEIDPLFLVCLSASIEILRSLNGEHQIRSIRCPTLLVHGTRDVIVPISDMEEISRQIPSRRLQVLRLPDEDHFYTHSLQSVLSETAKFVREIDPSSRR